MTTKIDYNSKEWNKFKDDMFAIFTKHLHISEKGCVEGNPSIHQMSEYAYHYARGQIKSFLLGRLEMLEGELSAEWDTIEKLKPGSFEREQNWEMFHKNERDLKIITEFINETIKTLDNDEGNKI